MSLYSKITDRLFSQVSIESLALFRIVYGFLAFSHVFGYWIYYHLELDIYNPDRIQFRYLPFEWLPTFHDPWMSMIMLGISALGLLVMAGIWYRWATWLLAFGLTYVFLLEKATYLNHAYLFAWIAFAMPFFPADRAYSLRVRFAPEQRLEQMQFWPLFIWRFMMGTVYFYGGLAKINTDWVRAVPVNMWMKSRHDAAIIGPILQQDWVPWVMAYGGMFLDLSAAFLLINKRTRPWIFGFIIGFHAANAMIFNIGIFPALSITLSALFFPPDFPSRVAKWFRAKFGAVTGSVDTATHEARKWTISPDLNKTVVVSIALLIAFHWLIPFRHHFYPGHVAFTEEGHRYSWRMMLRSKSGSGHFIVKDEFTGLDEKVYPRDHLWPKQRRKLYTHPDMIWQFAQELKALYGPSNPDLEIYARIKVRLNDHPRQVYIDPDRNLANEDWPLFGHCDWIMEQEDSPTWAEIWENITSR